jgi:D-psicose/D-tagatose/L-ribulose 3-epimerase
VIGDPMREWSSEMRNPVGCHGLVWTDQFDLGSLEQVARRTAAAGFDLLEVPFMNPWAFDGTGAGRSSAPTA